jgi:pentatricopeptide repeat protein
LERDAYTYGTALGAYAKKGLWQEALALLRKVEGLAGAGARVRLTTVMYNTVLSALGKAGQCEAAVDLYESMFASPGTAPDRVTHFTLMAALEAAGRRKQAVQLRAHLRTGKTDFFAGLRAGAAENDGAPAAGDGGNVVVVVDKADEDLLADTDITLSPAGTLRDKILSAGRRRGAGAGAGKAFKWEKGGGGAASLMKLLGAAGQVDAAERLLRQLEADNGNEPLPTALYNAAIEACGGAGGGAGDWRRALALYASMSGKQVARDVQTYRAIVPLLEAAAMTAEPEADHALRLVLARGKL